MYTVLLHRFTSCTLFYFTGNFVYIVSLHCLLHLHCLLRVQFFFMYTVYFMFTILLHVHCSPHVQYFISMFTSCTPFYFPSCTFFHLMYSIDTILVIFMYIFTSHTLFLYGIQTDLAFVNTSSFIDSYVTIIRLLKSQVSCISYNKYHNPFI